jgi:hypothetical protein
LGLARGRRGRSAELKKKKMKEEEKSGVAEGKKPKKKEVRVFQFCVLCFDFG